MKQFLPAVRALCEQVRQPSVIRLFVGLGLIAPAALFSKTMDRQVTVERLAPVVVAAPVQPVLALAEPQDSLAAAEVVSPERYAQEYRVSQPLAAEIHKAAVATGIAPKIAFGLVRAESSFRTRAVSPVGAVGLTQLMPATARWLKPGTTRGELMQPKTNLRLGFTYLKQLIDRYDGNEKLALTAFNRGPGTVDKALRQGRNPDNGYYDKVLTGKSAKHVSLMNAKFGKRKR
jgi:soluble lytic murein transglycosylase-like protein